MSTSNHGDRAFFESQAKEILEQTPEEKEPGILYFRGKQGLNLALRIQRWTVESGKKALVTIPNIDSKGALMGIYLVTE